MAQPAQPKTAEESAQTPTLIPQANGGALLSGGVPGNKGGGRPPNAFKDFLATLRAKPEAQAALEKAALNPESRGFTSAWKLAAEYDDEKPVEKKQLSGEVVVRVVRDE